MKKSNLIFTFAAVLLLLIPCLILGSEPAKAADVPVQDRMISIDKQDQDFTQTLEAIADQAGITINVHGQIPKTTRDISLDQVPLNQALARILDIFGVRNHVAAYSSDTETYMLTLLGSHLTAANDRIESDGFESPVAKRKPKANETEAPKERLEADDEMLPDVDAYAEEYHRKRQSQEQPVEYPEGLSQEEIDAIGREMLEF